jgi:hypothetical protein
MAIADNEENQTENTEEQVVEKKPRPRRRVSKTSPSSSTTSEASAKKTPQGKSKLNLNTRFIVLIGIFMLAAFLLALNFESIRGLFVAATVNGEAITRMQVIKELEQQGGRQMLDSLISRTLIDQEARKNGIVASREDIQAEMAGLEATFQDQGSSLDDALAAQGMTREDLAEQLRFQVILQKLLAGRVEVSDAELDEYIEENRENLPEEIDAEFREQLRESLVQQNLGRESQLLLTMLRDQADINYFIEY